jgi:hypothetical protein
MGAGRHDLTERFEPDIAAMTLCGRPKLADPSITGDGILFPMLFMMKYIFYINSRCQARFTAASAAHRQGQVTSNGQPAGIAPCCESP